MRKITAVLITLLLMSCSRFNPAPPPAPTAQAQEIQRAQSGGLLRLGTDSVTVRGSPDDAERALASKATAAGASYYQILLVKETVEAGMWYASAIFYGPAQNIGAHQVNKQNDVMGR
ncbi:biofilm peroxide resistance protein BsmA [Erwinia piriflorinigrans]|uniref:UPF0379 lipoprotein n=1 Tax=Erwinia piriflorinigrans CFBP 5888 TaxID=1161919 RepID=V5ZBJ2_9GAMM|nr:biofilm peroxide resistance protein BsmA [Erwinia piriflorinigrans]CCG88625.1 UPF0379 lipoprotein [Erwinia piriflorinigrans CFBP 5888]